MGGANPPAVLRIGVLGTAKIARAFIAAVASSTAVAVAAIASRTEDKARQFAGETGVAHAYGSYEALLRDPQIEAVYNPLPNSLHADWSIRAMAAGKHVLCEKPLAATAAEARAMFAAARQHGVRLAEGFPYLAQPHMKKLRDLLATGAIGRVQTMQAAFGFPLSDPANIRLDPALAGGALMDAGVYPLSLVRIVAGRRPTRVTAVAHRHPGGVDQTLVATLEHADGLLAQISCSFCTSVHREATLAGSQGMIQTTYLNDPPQDRPAVIRLKQGTAWGAGYETLEVPAVGGFRAEAESFAAFVRQGPEQWSGATAAESLDIALSLEAIGTSARESRPVDLA